jgi:signal transduction histidine kinase/ligand-binding sensor domain-containing protein
MLHTLQHRRRAYSFVAMSIMVGPFHVLSAQDLPREVHPIHATEELPSPIVTALAQDRVGFLWIGTTGGLARFDGSGLTGFEPDPTNGATFPSGSVRSLAVTPDDALWISVEGVGIVILDPGRTSFSVYQADEGDRADEGDSRQLASSEVGVLLADRSGRVWVGEWNAQIAVIDPESNALSRVRWEGEMSSGGPDDRIGALAEGPDGRIWAGTFAGELRYIDPETLESTAVSMDFGPGVPPSPIRAFHFSEDGYLWVGTWGAGIARLDLDTFNTRWIRSSDPTGLALSSDAVIQFAPGDDGVFWAATAGGGINRIDQHTFGVEWLTEPLPELRTVSILRVSDRSFWVGTWGAGIFSFETPLRAFRTYFDDGNSGLAGPDVTDIAVSTRPATAWVTVFSDGLHTIDLTTGELRKSAIQPFGPETTQPRLYRVIETSDGSIYVGTWGLGARRLRRGATRFEPVPGDWISSGTVTGFHEDPEGRVWIGTRSGLGVIEPSGVEVRPVPFDFLEPDLPEPWIEGITSAADGSLVVGTRIGLAALDPATHRGRWLLGGSHQTRPGGGQSNDAVNAIAVGPDGSIWSGLEAGGLVNVVVPGGLLEDPAPLVRRGIARNALPNPKIQAIEFDAGGRLWISTEGGLVEFDPSTNTARAFFEGDGLAGNVSSLRALVRIDDTILLGTTMGLTVFDPREIPYRQEKPTVAVTGVRRIVSDDMTFDALSGDTLQIPWGEGSLLIDYSVIDLRHSARPRYEYRLATGQTWEPVEQGRTVFFSGKPPGKYDLVVRARTGRGELTEESRSLTLLVVAPWWMTGWARTLGVLVFIGSVYGFNRTRTVRIRGHNAALRREIADRKRAESDRDLYEEEFRQSQKLEAVGQLTGGVAHDFNNFLTVILGNLELIALERPGDPEVSKYATDAIHAADQAGALTQRLLSFSRKQVLNPSMIDASVVIPRVAELVRPALGANFEFRVTIAGGVGTFMADSAHLESALLNLVINARDAQRGGGLIECAAENRMLTASEALAVDFDGAADLFGEADSLPFVGLSIRDHGEGMTPEVRRQAFDPFFTTKEVGTGSGLGLSMVHGFVRQSSGLLAIDSTVGEGTVVTLLFPMLLGDTPRTGLHPREISC